MFEQAKELFTGVIAMRGPSPSMVKDAEAMLRLAKMHIVSVKLVVAAGASIPKVGDGLEYDKAYWYPRSTMCWLPLMAPFSHG